MSLIETNAYGYRKKYNIFIFYDIYIYYIFSGISAKCKTRILKYGCFVKSLLIILLHYPPALLAHFVANNYFYYSI